MSRLYDRIRAFGCERLRPAHLATEKHRHESRERGKELFLAEHGDEFNEETAARLAEYAASPQAQSSFEPIATEKLDASLLDDVPVIAADEVGAYVMQLLEQGPEDILDHLAVLAPPFDSFFVEVQGVSNPRELNSWGLLIRNFTGEFGWDDKRPESVGWELEVTLVIEPDKNNPIGPVARCFLALDHEGRWLRHDDGEAVFAGKLVSFEPEDPPPEAAQKTVDSLVPYVFAGLLAVSLTHCRNVEAAEINPDPRAAKRWAKKGRPPLSRYQVLDVGAMTTVLDREGEATAKGLGHALHICRGHFKTFSEDAPLFGRVSGMFWWADQVRGNREHGEVVKDYAVHHDAVLGQAYQAAEESPELAKREHSGPDPDAAGRGLGAHNRTQNLLAEAVRRAGLDPRSPGSGEPLYDLGWASDRFHVAEVKSTTPQNEERQLRLAVGQVVRYRQQLTGPEREIQAVIAAERRPSDESWIDLCNEQGVVLCWPEVFDLAVRVPEELGGY